MNTLRHMALDYALQRLLGDRPRPVASAAPPRASAFDALWEEVRASGPLRERAGERAVRASDADREEVVALLNRHYAEGRLDTDELAGRVETAYGARRLAELEPLTRDLPEMPSSAGSPARPRRTARPIMGFAALGITALLVVAFASLMPAEVWAPLVMLVLALAPLALFAIVPLAFLAIPLFLLRGPRVLTRADRAGYGRHSIVADTGRDWVRIKRL